MQAQPSHSMQELEQLCIQKVLEAWPMPSPKICSQVKVQEPGTRETSVPGSILLLPTTVTKADTEMHFRSGALHRTGPTIHQVPLAALAALTWGDGDCVLLPGHHAHVFLHGGGDEALEDSHIATH